MLGGCIYVYLYYNIFFLKLPLIVWCFCVCQNTSIEPPLKRTAFSSLKIAFKLHSRHSHCSVHGCFFVFMSTCPQSTSSSFDLGNNLTWKLLSEDSKPNKRLEPLTNSTNRSLSFLRQDQEPCRHCQCFAHILNKLLSFWCLSVCLSVLTAPMFFG